ncbi:MAG TPA: T3SS effector HopA1 family protein [Acidobacteriaceae bacterium]|nr:T3SS effector HopA1 family protein [Acidobacteriaceae bacterium]
MSIHLQLRAVLEAVTVLSADSFRFRDEPVRHAAEFPPMPQGPGYPFHPMSEHPLVRALQTTLYGRCYSHSLERPPEPVAGNPVPSPELVERLSAANASRPRWESGWRVFEVQPTGALSVLKGDSQLTVQPGDYISHAGAYTPVAPGGEVAIRMHAESRTLQIGFFYVFGETPGDLWDDHYTVRYYLNAPESLAPAAVRFVSERLNQLQVPFRMKALTVPQWYTRTDSMVLYVARRYHTAVSRMLAKLPAALGSHLPPDTPLFTKRLQPGVGLAEDPRTGESFGMHRCRLVAEGLVDAALAGKSSLPAKTRAVYRRFSKAGIPVERCFLNAGTVDLYEAAAPHEVHA